MPDRSRHKRGKRTYQSHKSKAIARRADVAARKVQPEEKQTVTAPPEPIESKTSRPAPAVAAVTAIRYPYIKSELVRIGILFGIILIILIILSKVLR